MAETGADGMNGDTMDGVPNAFFEYSLQINQPKVMQPECPTNGTCTGHQGLLDYRTNVQSYIDITFTPVGKNWPVTAPVLSAYRLLTSARHQTYFRKRWATDRTDFIQHAFFNGAGYFVWENVWG